MRRVAIHVYPDSSVVVDAPKNTLLSKIKSKVTKRAKWIRKQQRYFDRYPPALPARKYVSGESFHYLGRQHTLEVKRGILNEVKLHKGKLFVSTTRTGPKHIKALVDAWYRSKAKIVFQERIKECLKKASKIGVNYEVKTQIRAMKTRWGSCSKEQRITLNPELMGAPKECIDYVIIHELCHLREYHHGKEFYKLLTSIMPDWKQRKDKLETTIEHRDI